MKWHVVCRIGEEDEFFPELETAADKHLVLHFSGGTPSQRVREHVIEFIERLHNATVNAAVQDFLYGAMTAYLADLCIPRASAADRWSRAFVLHLPVFEHRRWRRAGSAVASTLRFLTGDAWEVSTRERSCDAPEVTTAADMNGPTSVSLLSGGLDSFVGAIDALDRGGNVAFVSHYGGGLTRKPQKRVFDAIRRSFAGQCQDHPFFVLPPHLDDHGENTMRSRSVLFLALGVAVASVLGNDVSLLVPENGLISLNVPLTGTRVGSSSTRTTHPHFIAGVRDVLSELCISTDIVLPYRHATKGEMLRDSANADILKATLHLTMSCSHPEVARWERSAPGTHCGYCFPCLIRRAAVVAANLEEYDATYTHDVLEQIPIGKRGSDLRAIKMALQRARESACLPALIALKAGPLPSEELSQFADVYARGMTELDAFFSGSE